MYLNKRKMNYNNFSIIIIVMLGIGFAVTNELNKSMLLFLFSFFIVPAFSRVARFKIKENKVTDNGNLVFKISTKYFIVFTILPMVIYFYSVYVATYTQGNILLVIIMGAIISLDIDGLIMRGIL